MALKGGIDHRMKEDTELYFLLSCCKMKLPVCVPVLVMSGEQGFTEVGILKMIFLAKSPTSTFRCFAKEYTCIDINSKLSYMLFHVEYVKS